MGELTGTLPPEAKEWLPFKPQSPIRKSDIPNLVTLLNWHPVDPGFGHYGYDIAAYIAKTASGFEVVIGLPKYIPVYAIADGTIIVIKNNLLDVTDKYQQHITMEHRLGGLNNLIKKPLYSDYQHVLPTIQVGQKVRKGQQIATLFADDKWGDEKGRLVHLHFLTRNGPSLLNYVDPVLVLPEIIGPKCIPHEEITNFQIEGHQNLPIRIAHYKSLRTTKTHGR